LLLFGFALFYGGNGFGHPLIGFIDGAVNSDAVFGF